VPFAGGRRELPLRVGRIGAVGLIAELDRFIPVPEPFRIAFGRSNKFLGYQDFPVLIAMHAARAAAIAPDQMQSVEIPVTTFSGLPGGGELPAEILYLPPQIIFGAHAHSLSRSVAGCRVSALRRLPQSGSAETDCPCGEFVSCAAVNCSSTSRIDTGPATGSHLTTRRQVSSRASAGSGVLTVVPP
jgi:hypothetical protein